MDHLQGVQQLEAVAHGFFQGHGAIPLHAKGQGVGLVLGGLGAQGVVCRLHDIEEAVFLPSAVMDAAEGGMEGEAHIALQGLQLLFPEDGLGRHQAFQGHLLPQHILRQEDLAEEAFPQDSRIR